MNITPITVTIEELTKNYQDDGENGVSGYVYVLPFNGSLSIKTRSATQSSI